MPIGPGKYDELAEYCINKVVDADAVVVIVFTGTAKGGGMSVKVRLSSDFEIAIRNLAVIDRLPGVLRNVAESIEKDANRTI